VRERKSLPSAGFSLVELMVAVVFTSLLMAGLASVFSSGISALATHSDAVASGRRNRLGLEMFQNDLNTAGMYLESMGALPQLSASNPGFYVIPNRPVQDDAGNAVAAGGTLPTLTDEIYMYMDSALPLEATLKTRIQGLDELVAAGGTMPANVSFDIQFTDSGVASQVKKGQFVVFKDWYASKLISDFKPGSTLNSVNVTIDPNPQVTVQGCGATYLDKFAHPADTTRVLVVNRGQMVRYRIKAKAVDPSGALTPCLVREELPYNAGGNAANPTSIFPAATADQIITEDVSAFKVYLSGNRGAAWAGTNLAASVNDFGSGWTNGLFNQLQGQVPSAAALQNNPNWFRSVPVLVRVDLSTRTPIRRAEYVADRRTYVTAGYKDRTQSLVMLPRHFGLAM
jgi:type II secretory pathway pseudopilin PulG